MSFYYVLARTLAAGLASTLLPATPVLAQLELTPDTAPDRTLDTQIQRDVVPGVDLITGGTRPQNGQNLFHSFQEFNIQENRGAYFENPAGVRNILTRVTGNDSSDILGTLGVLGTANLFLINPNGILFGRNASLDLRGGSFYGTTASGIKFGEVGEFSAVSPQPPSSLLTINPSAFFFTARPPGAIVNQSQATQTILGDGTDGLRVRNGQNLMLLGGNVTLDGGLIVALGGRVEIGAVAETGTVKLNNNGSLTIPDGLKRGDVAFVDASQVAVEFRNAGDIAVTANNISILGGSVLSAGILQGVGTSTSQAGDINLNATGLVQVGQFSKIANDVNQNATGNSGSLVITANALEVRDGVQLSATTFSNGNAGNVIIEVRDRILFDNSFISSSVAGTGKGGNVQISTHSLAMLNGAILFSATLGTGDAGNVIIEAHDRVLFDNSRAFSSVGEAGKGQGGNIQIFTNALEVLNGAELDASTFGAGNAGNVIIEAHTRAVFNNGSAFSTVGDTGVGQGGNIYIFTNVLEVLNQTGLFTGTFGIGDAGDVIIEAHDRVLFDNSSAFSSVIVGRGQGGNIQISTNSLAVLNQATLFAATSGIGNAGNVIIEAHDRVLFDNGRAYSSVGETGKGQGGNVQIFTSSLAVVNGAGLFSSTFGPGDAGNVMIEARDRVLFDNGFASSSVGETGKGQGGNIQIFTNALEVLNGARLISSTLGNGDAGDVMIEVRDRVLFGGISVDRQLVSGAFSTVEETGIGQGGDVQISTNTLEVLSGAQLSARTRGIGNAGNIEIQARDAVLIRGTGTEGRSSALFTSTLTDESGGNITVNTRTFEVADGAVVDARTQGNGSSGNVTIKAERVNILNGGQLLAITESRGRAGNITVNASERLTLAGTDSTYATRFAEFGTAVVPISAASGIFVRSQGTGGAGDITVTTPQLRMDQGVISAESAAVDGGNINLNVGQLLLVRNGSLISATAGTAQQSGNGGNITINVPDGFIVGVKSENSDITANAFTGSGGRVNITAQGIFGLEFRPQLTELSDITASSTFGASGVVTLNTPNVDPSRGLVQLPQSLIDTNRILANSCIVRDRATGGIFLITGTGGLPIRPGDPPLPVFPTGEVQGIEKAESGKSQIQNPKSKIQNVAPIVEARGIYQLPDGQLILSWECGK